MKTIFDALYAKLQGSPLSVAIGGRYYPIQGPVGTAVPYCVASIISELPRYALAHIFNDVLIEISVFATDATTMHTVSELVFSLFDRSTLSGLVGYEQVGPMDRDSGQPLIMDGVYRYIIEYRLNLKKL